ncbi:MAG: hypothetical protein KDC95_24790, partial [Planctomycetes bacterium]|nr:hypothetical protein [Planctomycetota bacterium]
TVLTTILTIFAIVPDLGWGPAQAATEPEVPDLCTDDVYLDPDGVPLQDSDGTQLSRHCTWTDEDAPVWADQVCCEFGPDSVSCTPTNTNGECTAIQVKRWCDFAEYDGAQVECLQPFPSACNSGVCGELPVGTQPEEGSAPLCCYPGGCYELEFDEYCGGLFQWCDSPFTNGDGTVGCAD